MLSVLDVKHAIGMLCHVADTIIENKPMLTEVDSKIGDGDHGIGMAGGMKKARDKVVAMSEEDNVYAIFAAAGKAMLMSMGGASGVIFGSMFLAGAKDAPPSNAITPDAFCAMMEQSLKAIMDRGGAKVGDKTMVDALSPAVDAMREQCGCSDLAVMLCFAETAAKAGMEKTKDYVAKYGRAKSLMERSIGFQDAGATSVWLIFRAMREYAENPV